MSDADTTSQAAVLEALQAPLAHLEGALPSAPDWFQNAIDHPHNRNWLTVDGAEIEWLEWGAPASPQDVKPGLLLLHGNAAHADWWRFIAPFFAQTHHVVAFSWSGMGNSSHRPTYKIETFMAEIAAVAAEARLGAAGPYTVMGHSFGGFPMMAYARAHGEQFKQAIILDTPFNMEQRRRPRNKGGDARPHQIYPSLEAALARFRWSPLQPSPHLFITDFIARHSLKQTDGGFSWKFDPYLWSEFEMPRDVDLLADPKCPVALIWGEKSELLTPKLVANMAGRLPKNSRYIPIPEAYHHVMADEPLALVSALRALLA